MTVGLSDDVTSSHPHLMFSESSAPTSVASHFPLPSNTHLPWGTQLLLESPLPLAIYRDEENKEERVKRWKKMKEFNDSNSDIKGKHVNSTVFPQK